MTLHPMIISLLFLDGIVLILLIRTGFSAFRILIGWSPERSDQRQLRLEKISEAVSIEGEWAAVFQGLALFGLFLAISLVLPTLVPGAMCGTGVIQATEGYGHRAIGLRVLAFGLIYFWRALDRIDRNHETGVLTLFSNRFLLLSIPVYLAALVDTFKAAACLESHAPVQCCSTVYRYLNSSSFIPETAQLFSDRYWLIAFLILSAILALLAIAVFLGPDPNRRKGMLLPVIGIAWAGVSLVTLGKVLVPYYYGVLRHDCLWCLFLPDHWMAGFLLFFLLLMVLFESPVVWLAASIAKKYPALMPGAMRHYRRAGLKVAVGVTVFTLLTIMPAVLWRFRFGVWMG